MRISLRWLLLFLLGIHVFYVLAGAIRYPLWSIDTYGIWFFKAKAWFLVGGVPWQTLRDTTYLFSHPQYPLGLPALVGSFYLLTGAVQDRVVLLLYPMVYLGVLILCYRVLRACKFHSTSALALTYLYSMFSPLLGQGGRMHAGNADIILVLLYWIAVFIWIKHKLKTAALWIVVLTALASQIKTEGLFLAWLLIFLPIRIHRKMLLIGLAAIPTVLWFMVLRFMQIPSDFSLQLFSLNMMLSRGVEIVAASTKELLNWRNWYVFWPIFFGLACLFRPNPRVKTLGKVLCGMAASFFLIYLFTSLDAGEYVSSSLDRVLLQLSPFWFPLFADYLRQLFKLQQVTRN